MMKFNKIEISAFRIYDDPKNATFDFTVKENEVANFVSIYAPNGFGKTSFYDAVEWGMTNYVQRFWQHKGITEDALDAQKSLSGENNIRLLRNRNSTNPTYVEITTTGEVLPRRTLSKTTGKVDVPYDKNIQNKEFQKVILSQEWIAGFLREVDGKIRYEKFVKNPEFEEVDLYFKNVKVLKTICDEKISTIKVEILSLEKKIRDFEGANILENINWLITKIIERENDSKLQSISVSASQKEIIDFKSLVAIKIIQYSNETSFTEVLQNLMILKSGDENKHIVGIDKFFENTEAAKNINEKLRLSVNNLKKFSDLEQARIGLKNNYTLQVELIQTRDKIDVIISEFSEYQAVFSNIHSKQIDLTKAKKELSELQLQIEKITGEFDEIQVKYNTSLNEIAARKDLKTKLPAMEKEENELDGKIVKEEYELEKLNTDFKTKNDEISIVNQKIADYKCIIKNIENDILTDLQNYPKLQDTIHSLQICILDIKDTKEKIKSIELKIENQKLFISSLEEFIQSGLSLVNEQKLLKCPLCEQEYKSYEALADKISKNSALSEVGQELTVKSNELGQVLRQLSDGKLVYVKDLCDYFIEEIRQIEENRKLLESAINQLKKDIDKKKPELEELKEKKKNFRSLVEGLSYIEFNQKLVDRLVKEEQSGRELKGDLDAKSKTLREKKDYSEILKAKMNLISNSIQELQSNEHYLKVIEWYKLNYPEVVITEQPAEMDLLVNKKSTIVQEIEKVGKEILQFQSSVHSLEEELKCLDRDFLLNEKRYWENRKTEIEQENSSYSYFLKDKINYIFKNDSKEDLLLMIENKETELNVELQKIRSLREDYQKLEKYNDIIIPFLESEKVKAEIDEKKIKLKFYQDEVKIIIEKEIEKAKTFLNEKVKDFLYEDLLQKIYRKIDPHPNFKSVRFELNLDGSVPTLDVFTKSADEDETIIPNLYFSTAQINVLSLSIFLASALNSSEYDCIFIDDPVQSMDSINVLSTIDLLRSIAFNLDKQIILSTHDQNFHNLLKKKMPPDSFKSKFIEFETFGKVRRN